jgi:hypothetical protein
MCEVLVFLADTGVCDDAMTESLRLHIGDIVQVVDDGYTYGALDLGPHIRRVCIPDTAAASLHHLMASDIHAPAHPEGWDLADTLPRKHVWTIRDVSQLADTMTLAEFNGHVIERAATRNPRLL